MAIINFPENQFALILDSSTEFHVASHTLSESGELRNIRAKIFNKGDNSASRIRLNVYPENSNNKLFSSEWVNISDIEQNFYGFIRFDFQKNNIQKNYKIKIFAEIENYSTDLETNYFAFIYDFPIPVYDNLETHFNDHPIALEDFIFV